MESGKMANIDKSGIGRLVFGILVMVFGIMLLFYEQVDKYELYGIPFSVSRGYPYQFVGIPLILVGIIFAIIGSYRWKMRPKKEMLKSNDEATQEEPKDSSETQNPLKLLQLRLTKGEISKDEYEELRKVLDE
jgi:uncharacterized membrane protein